MMVYLYFWQEGLVTLKPFQCIFYHDPNYNKYYNYNMYNIMAGIAQLKAFSCANKKNWYR